MLAFLFMAVFAPVISPYSIDFRAPSIDVFVADSTDKALGALGIGQRNWTAPIGLTADTRENQLQRILLYSRDVLHTPDNTTTYSPGLLFDVSPGTQKIDVSDPSLYRLPANLSYIQYVHFPRTATESTFFFILQGQTLYEYTSNLIDANKDYSLGYTPEYISNLWNGYSIQLNQGRMALVFTDGHNLTLIDKRPRVALDPVVRTWVSSVAVTDDTIISNPLVIDSDFFENGSMVVVPCSSGLRAYRIDVTEDPITAVVKDVVLGELMWRANYSINGESFQPIDSLNMMTYANPSDVTTSFGKTLVYVATTDARVIAFHRETGEVDLNVSKQLIVPAIRDPVLTGLFPSPNEVVAVGEAGSRGFVAGINPEFGNVDFNSTMYALTDSYLNSAPQYVGALRTWVFSSELGTIYLTDEFLRINVTFAAPSGGASSPVSYLGNIYIESSIAGNYFGVVTKDNTMFVETLTGVNHAPLPPGTYPSGNRYILGTDYEGHDILTWLIWGTRSELMVGITAAFFAVVIGTIVGLVAGFYPGAIDNILMRATDVVLSLPGLVILLLFAAVLGPSLINIIIIIGVLSWAGIARVIRSVTLSLKERAFVDAAIVAGASDSRLIFTHIAPNVLPYTFLYMTFTISGAIVTEAILSFLGFGDVNHVTWGMMLQFLQISGHALNAPWWLLPPGICITLLSMSFYLIGRAFDEVVNPRLRKR